jgi:hypothetical protein
MRNQFKIGNTINVGRSPWNKGKKGVQIVSELTRRKLSKIRVGNTNGFKKGKEHYNWKGGVTPIYKIIRESSDYKKWRRDVLLKGKYTCCFCLKRGGKLQADHIKPFALFPELRFEVTNGRVLCVACHMLTDTYAGKMKNYV